MSNSEFDTALGGVLPPLADGKRPVIRAAARGNAGGVNATADAAASDSNSVRRSEATLAGQIARAVARGQRVL